MFFTSLTGAALRQHWMRAALRWLPAQIIAAAALLGGCLPSASVALTPTANIGWERLAPGLERRILRPGIEYPLTQLIALRFDPQQYSFSAHYRPGAPLNVDGWRDELAGAVAFVNANYFDPQQHALGLVVADGVVYGQAYPDFGGMLQVQNGIARVRSTMIEPYGGEALEQAVQAFPMLIVDGRPAFTNREGDRISRRTVVGQDRENRILLIATSSLTGMRLVDLGRYLATTGLQLMNAVNLDGGGSTLLALDIPGQAPYQISSFDPVPTVLAVYPREG